MNPIVGTRPSSGLINMQIREFSSSSNNCTTIVVHMGNISYVQGWSNIGCKLLYMEGIGLFYHDSLLKFYSGEGLEKLGITGAFSYDYTHRLKIVSPAVMDLMLRWSKLYGQSGSGMQVTLQFSGISSKQLMALGKDPIIHLGALLISKLKEQMERDGLSSGENDMLMRFVFESFLFIALKDYTCIGNVNGMPCSTRHGLVGCLRNLLSDGTQLTIGVIEMWSGSVLLPVGEGICTITVGLNRSFGSKRMLVIVFARSFEGLPSGYGWRLSNVVEGVGNDLGGLLKFRGILSKLGYRVDSGDVHSSDVVRKLCDGESNMFM